MLQRVCAWKSKRLSYLQLRFFLLQHYGFFAEPVFSLLVVICKRCLYVILISGRNGIEPTAAHYLFTAVVPPIQWVFFPPLFLQKKLFLAKKNVAQRNKTQPCWLQLNEVALRAALLRLCTQGSHWPRKAAQCYRFLQLCVGFACCQKTLVTQSFTKGALLLRMWTINEVLQLFVKLLSPNAFKWKRTATVRVHAESRNTFCSSSQLDSSLKKGAGRFLSYCPATRKACSPSRVCVHVCDCEWRLVRERAFRPLCWNMRVPYTYRMVVVLFRRNCNAVVHGCQQNVVHRVPA